MANNYTGFSFVLRGLSTDQIAWLVERLRVGDEEYWAGMTYRKARARRKVYQLEGWYNPEWEVTPAQYEIQGSNLALYANGDGGEESVLADLLGVFLHKNPGYPPISFEWAYWCDRARVGEFGGGAVFITQDSAQWLSTSTWLDARRRELELIDGTD